VTTVKKKPFANGENHHLAEVRLICSVLRICNHLLTFLEVKIIGTKWIFMLQQEEERLLQVWTTIFFPSIYEEKSLFVQHYDLFLNEIQVKATKTDT